MRKRKFQCFYMGLIISMLFLTGCGTAQTEAVDVETKEGLESDSVIETEAVTGLLFDLPNGFMAEEDTSGFYKSAEYEEDYACIYYQEDDADERYELLTEETIAELMQDAYSELYGIDTEVQVLDFHRFNLDGYEAYRIETEYTVDEIPLQVIEYTVITEDKNFSVTYMQKKSAGWKTAFAQSAESLQVRQ